MSSISPHPEPIRVALVDDHELVRDGLRALLTAMPQLEVVGEASSGAEALILVGQVRPDLLLVDIGMKDMTGLQLTETLCRQYPGMQILILSMYDHAEYVTSSIRAGARGYVLKDAASWEIVAAIDAIAAGGSYYSTDLLEKTVSPPAADDELTPREREVLQMLVQGLSNKAIARLLDISVRTIETHRLSIRRKLGVDTPAGLVKYALERGWLSI
ncbi:MULTISPECIES: response regulator transcription factor [unclassified Pseudomonas]|uniref:response regulator transcription factor n=1 Tax=unclassified Pseudomonas TaxID=196821 RepID=UPI001EDE60CB|nr:response regulator transcription factor [Pseudomonas sp. MMS21 TM103]MCG4452363.1 response regulator transcription factor [Pseudomonas sp. MMS21 TM103]